MMIRMERPTATMALLSAWQRSLVTLVTLVGVWAIFHGMSEIFAAFTLRRAGKRVEQLVR
jgi:uncharacterized membrane protein HdeD (DUF308 family)